MSRAADFCERMFEHVYASKQVLLAAVHLLLEGDSDVVFETDAHRISFRSQAGAMVQWLSDGPHVFPAHGVVRELRAAEAQALKLTVGDCQWTRRHVLADWELSVH